MANQLNLYFKEGPLTLSADVPSASAVNDYLTHNHHSFFLSPFSDVEVSNIIRHDIKNKNSLGHNGVSNFIVEKAAFAIVKPFIFLINLSFEQGVFSAELKISKVVELHKKGDVNQKENWSVPNALASTFSNIFEYSFLLRLNSFIDKHKLLSNNQFGFVAGSQP